MKKRLILITLALVVLVLGINLATRGEYFSGRVQSYLIARARQALGFDVGMDSLVFNFFPAYIDLKKPYVRGWDKADPRRAIGADEARVYISLAGLLDREFSISRVQAHHLTADVVRLSGGGYNTDTLISRLQGLAGKQTPKGRGLRTKLKEVVLFDAAITYTDAEKGIGIEAKKAGMDYRLRGGGKYWLGLNIGDLTLKRGNMPPLHAEVKGDMLYNKGKAAFEALRVVSEGARVNASGTVLWSKTPTLDLKVGAAANLALLDRLGIWKGGPSGEAEMDGTVKGQYPAAIAGKGKLALRGVSYAGVKVDDLSSEVVIEKGVLTVPEIKSKLLGGSLQGRLAADFGGGSVSYRSDWTLKDLISGYYTGGRKDLAFIPWQTVSGRVQLSGRGFTAASLQAAGSIDLSRYDKPHPMTGVSQELSVIRSAHIGFGLKDSVITVTDGQAASNGSWVRFTGTVGLDGATDMAIKGRSDAIGEISTMIGYSDIQGSLDLTARMSGNLKEPVIVGKASIADARAHGIPFNSAYGDAKLSGWTISFNDFVINQGRGFFTLNGKIAFKGQGASFDNPHYTARLAVKDVDARKIIAIFYKDIPVNLRASGELGFDGDAGKFKGVGRITTSAGDVYGQAVDKGEVRAVLTERDINFPRVVAVVKRDIVTASGGIGFDGTFHGKASSARVDMSNFNLLMGTGAPVKGSVSVSATGNGRFDRPEISANVNAYRLYFKDVDLGAGKIGARIKDGAMTVNGSILEDKVRLEGSMGLSSPYTWRGRLTFNQGRFEPFIRLVYKNLPEDVSLVSTGVFTANGALDEPGKNAFSVNFSSLSAFAFGRKLQNSGDIAFDYRDGRFAVRSLKLQGEGAELEVTGGADSLKNVNLDVKFLTSLDSLKQLMKDSAEYLDGSVQAEMKVKGDIRAPALSGWAKVSDAGVKFKDFPQKFDHISATVQFGGGGFTLTALDGESGGGTVSATGRGGLKGYFIDNFLFNIDARDVKLKYPEGLSSSVDASLQFEGVGEQRSISGELRVNKARYTERIDWKSWLLQLQKKRTEVQAGGAGAAGEIALNVHVTAGESIHVDNNVAKMPVSADLTVRGTVSRPIFLGRLSASSGSVYFRNNEFKLTNAVAEFADPRRFNPIVDLQAETRVKEYLIQLTLSGTVDRIKVSFSSDPPLEDVDIITLLTLGRTSVALKGHESAITTGEAASFVTGQMQDAVEQRVRKLTGFDRFQVDPYLTSGSTTAGPRLTVGKSLIKDRLYITYSSNVGTSEEQFVRLEYIFSDNLSLVGERDELGHAGADFKFRFEFK